MYENANKIWHACMRKSVKNEEYKEKIISKHNMFVVKKKNKASRIE